VGVLGIPSTPFSQFRPSLSSDFWWLISGSIPDLRFISFFSA
jgi:hypothetical protein